MGSRDFVFEAGREGHREDAGADLLRREARVAQASGGEGGLEGGGGDRIPRRHGKTERFEDGQISALAPKEGWFRRSAGIPDKTHESPHFRAISTARITSKAMM